MAARRKKKIEEADLKGFKHFKVLNSILERLRDTACERDRAGNRELHYDQYAALIPRRPLAATKKTLIPADSQDGALA